MKRVVWWGEERVRQDVATEAADAAAASVRRALPRLRRRAAAEGRRVVRDAARDAGARR
jgi:predicted metal-dependent hydrolase